MRGERRSRTRRRRVVLALACAFFVIAVSWMFGTDSGILWMIGESSSPTSSERWVIVTQSDDCAGNLRLASAHARIRAWQRPRHVVHLVIRGDPSGSEVEGVLERRVTRLTSLLIESALIARGVRTTPVLVRVPSDRRGVELHDLSALPSRESP